jgi:hypothetical protein
VPFEVGHHERGRLLPRHKPERVEVGPHREVAVAARPRRHLVAVDRVHVDVDREQVVAALGALLGDDVEEVPGREPLALEAPLHVRDGQEHGVHRALGYSIAELVERHAPEATGRPS